MHALVKTCESSRIISQLSTGQEASLCQTRALLLLGGGGGLEAGLRHHTLATRAAVLCGHDISQSHTVRQLNESLFFRLTSSFVRGNDLPRAE